MQPTRPAEPRPVVPCVAARPRACAVGQLKGLMGAIILDDNAFMDLRVRHSAQQATQQVAQFESSVTRAMG